MARGHAPFAIFNRTANPVVQGLLRSPLHHAVSGRLALITVTGRRSGREHTFPVGYQERDGRVRIEVGWPERKRWWRNLLEPSPVRLRLRGVEHTGTALARGDERSSVKVDVTLDP
ncbi:MAG: nitroreductase/quinone reductase family protein [Solirubrobacterales bacterium]